MRTRPSLSRHGTRDRVVFCALFALLLGCLGWLLFFNLGEYHIVDYDEARHGINAYEMIRNGDYIAHTFQGETDYWNLKPPLSMWSIAASYRLFGYTAFALRFPSALAMLLSAAMLALWARRRFGRKASLLALLMLTANAMLFQDHFARFGDADSQYQLFFTLSMLCMLQSDEDFRWLYGCAFCFSLAFLEKATHAVSIPTIVFFYLLLTGRLRELRFKRVGLLLLYGLGPVVGWGAARWAKDGSAFFRAMFQTDVAGRVGSVADPAHLGIPPLLYYLRIFATPAMAVCLGVCLLTAIWLLVKRIPLGMARARIAIGCALWLFLPIALYALMNVRYLWYVDSAFTALPALSLTLLSALPTTRVPKVRACAAAALAISLVVMTCQNVRAIADIRFGHTVQSFLMESLDRDFDSDSHAYIQYGESIDNGQITTWMPANMLTSLLYGDVVCLDGGADAFMRDEEPAILFIVRENNETLINELYGEYPYRNDSYYLVAFDN